MRSLAAIVAGALAFSGCVPDFAKQNESNVILRIVEISTESGEDQEQGTFLLSDVDPVFNDNVQVTVEALPKNPNPAVLGRFNDVLLERYEVRYVRSDGLDQEGVDVPFRISGGLSLLVPAGSTATAGFVIVRHTAKLEPPLRNLRFTGQVAGGANLLTVSAVITLHGRTTSGKAVMTSGRVEIVFGDFADAT